MSLGQKCKKYSISDFNDEQEKTNVLPGSQSFTFTYNKLRGIAKRQISSLLRRRVYASHKDIYTSEIKKVIEFELKNHPNGE
jgi:hypothetical protein